MKITALTLLLLAACEAPGQKPGAAGTVDTDGNPAVQDQDGDGLSELDGDCNDADAAVHPGATETCLTEADDDCDGSASAVDAEGCTVWYLDADGDGYGVADDSVCACAPEAPYAADNTDDCDDADPEANTLEQPCRFDTTVPNANADAAYYGVESGDGAGTKIAFVGDLQGDGTQDIAIGAVNEDTVGYGAGAVYVLDDPLLASPDLALATAILRGECSGCDLGMAIAGVGDADGDGFDDLLLGERGFHTGEVLATGAVLLSYGPVLGDQSVGDASDLRYDGEGGQTGISVSSAGDMDGDGLPELLAGQIDRSTVARYAGGALVLPGAQMGALGPGDELAVVDGESEGDYAGWALDGGVDVSGDGVGDILIGAHWSSEVDSSSGAAYLVLGPVVGTRALADADLKLLGEAQGDLAGRDVALVSDLDADGLDDLLIGAYWEATAGAVYTWTATRSGSFSLAEATAVLRGDEDGTWTGFAADDAGDMDLDGHGDFVVGTGLGPTAHLCYGPVVGETTTRTSCTTFEEPAGGYFSYSVAGGGDVDGDGLGDLLFSAPAMDFGGLEANGYVTLFLAASYGRGGS